APCPACGTLLEVEVFPAFHRSLPAVAAAEAVLTDEEASCFFHPEKKAVVPCQACGRFLCLLCCGRGEIWARRDGLRDGLLLYQQRSHAGRPACGLAGVAGWPESARGVR